MKLWVGSLPRDGDTISSMLVGGSFNVQRVTSAVATSKIHGFLIRGRPAVALFPVFIVLSN